jgi:hypothetical protein
MTKLTTKVERETNAKIFECSKHREVIVTLAPPSQIGFRLKGTKRTYWLPAEACYWVALKAHTDAERKVKRARK